MPYKSQSARDAEQTNYGNQWYWEYLDRAAEECAEFYKRQGKPEMAEQMFTRSLEETLNGNNGG